METLNRSESSKSYYVLTIDDAYIQAFDYSYDDIICEYKVTELSLTKNYEFARQYIQKSKLLDDLKYFKEFFNHAVDIQIKKIETNYKEETVLTSAGLD